MKVHTHSAHCVVRAAKPLERVWLAASDVACPHNILCVPGSAPATR